MASVSQLDIRQHHKLKQRFGLRKYRTPQRCKECGCKALLFSPKAKVCFECALKASSK